MVIGARFLGRIIGSALNSNLLSASGPTMERPMVVPSVIGLGDGIGSGIAAGAGFVLDHEWLAEFRLQPVGRMRPILSGVDPGANGTMIRTLRVGQVPVCAWAVVANMARAAVNKTNLLMSGPDSIERGLCNQWGAGVKPRPHGEEALLQRRLEPWGSEAILRDALIGGARAPSMSAPQILWVGGWSRG